MRTIVGSGIISALLLAWTLSAHAETKPLRVCADPGNMPLSNSQGEGFQNKIAEVVAAGMGTTVTYDWRVSTERGLFRGTINANTCDLFMDLPTGLEMVLSTVPIYRSSFVLVSRSERKYDIGSLDDPLLKKLRIGVYQMSSIRESLGQHDVKQNVVVQHISYDGDRKPERQPSYLVQRVIDGDLDMAGIWGPFAGWYKTKRNAPIDLLPVNRMDDVNRLEFDMSVAVRRGDVAFKKRIEEALQRKKGEIRRILDDYGVPLVQCDACLVSGEIPSHGPYGETPPAPATQMQQAEDHESLNQLKQWLKQGADPDRELSNAVIADDLARVRYLVELKANVDARDAEGYTTLHNATRIGGLPVATFLIEHDAQVNATDRDGWTPLMFAAWRNSAEMARLLLAHNARLEASNTAGLTPLTIATQHGRSAAALVLIEAGADVNRAVGAGGFTPLMLAAAKNSGEVLRALVAKGAQVNARNGAGYTALMIAAAGNFPDAARLLIEAGADMSIQSEDGNTALAIARERENGEVIELLESKQSSALRRPAIAG